MLIKLPGRMVDNWKSASLKDEEILLKFMEFKDADLEDPEFLESQDPIVKDYASRIVDRLLPRLVFGFVTNN
jgi:hypothetical protein